MTRETYDKLELAVQKSLDSIDYSGNKDSGITVEKATSLAQLLVSIDKDENDAWDKQERREIERNKNEETIKAERDKQKLTWGRVGFEMAKVLAPLAVSIAGYNVFQKRMFKFEETGRISSTAGRELHLPKFFK